MQKPLTWLNRAALGELLTTQLRQVVGCEGATIRVGASHDMAPGEGNWFDFFTTAPKHADPVFVRAVAGAVVSEARERYNVLDS
jgi:hypothetical protein